jgi:UDP-N-acetyl-D-mannosaminuronic acid transferase (WecB/TagA/CpsF family)
VTGILDQPAFNRDRLKAEKLIDSKVLEQLIRVQGDAGCSSASQEEEVVEEILTSKADCLFIGMPTPRKERFLARYRDHLQFRLSWASGEVWTLSPDM